MGESQPGIDTPHSYDVTDSAVLGDDPITRPYCPFVNGDSHSRISYNEAEQNISCLTKGKVCTVVHQLFVVVGERIMTLRI